MSARAWLAILLAVGVEILLAWLAWRTGDNAVMLAVVAALTVVGCWLMTKAVTEKNAAK